MIPFLAHLLGTDSKLPTMKQLLDNAGAAGSPPSPPWNKNGTVSLQSDSASHIES